MFTKNRIWFGKFSTPTIILACAVIILMAKFVVIPNIDVDKIMGKEYTIGGVSLMNVSNMENTQLITVSTMIDSNGNTVASSGSIVVTTTYNQGTVVTGVFKKQGTIQLTGGYGAGTYDYYVEDATDTTAQLN